MTRTAFTAQWQKISPALSRVGSILASQGPRILYLKLLNRWRRVDYRRMFAASLQDSSLPTAGEEKELAGTFASSGASASAGTSASSGASASAGTSASAGAGPESVTPPAQPLLFSIIVPLYNTQSDHLTAMIASVQAQTYPHWQLCLADGSDQDRVQAQVSLMAAADNRISYQRLTQNQGISGNTNAALAMASGDYIALLDHDDLLAPQALAKVHQAIVNQGADLIYSDEMNFSGDISQVSLIHFKPDFAPDNLRSNNYICHLTVFSRALSDTIGGFDPACDGSQDYDYILRLSEQARKIVHIPQILYYWRIHSGSVASDISVKPYCLDAARLALSNHLQRTGQSGQVENNTILSTYRIRYPLAQDLRALIVVHIHHPRDLRHWQRLGVSMLGAATQPGEPATQARQGKLAGISTRWVFLMAADCLDRAGEKTAGQAGQGQLDRWHSASARTAVGLDSAVVALIQGEPVSASINRLVRAATEPLLIFLNGTVRSLSSGWLEELAQQALRPEIGLATGKITQRDLICQAGLATGIAGSLSGYHAGRVDGEPGYMARLTYVNNISAADQTVMAVSRAHFLSVDGFDERYQSDLFDLDLAFRLSQQGLHHVFTPYATATIRDTRQLTVERLKHRTCDPADHTLLHSLWGKTIAQPDPFYNPNFNQTHARFDQR